MTEAQQRGDGWVPAFVLTALGIGHVHARGSHLVDDKNIVLIDQRCETAHHSIGCASPTMVMIWFAEPPATPK